MTQALLHTADTLGPALTHLPGAAAVAPAIETDNATDVVGPPGSDPDQVLTFAMAGAGA